MRFLIPVLLAFALSSCAGVIGTAAEKVDDLMSKGKEEAREGLAEVLNVQCKRDLSRRQELVAAINDYQAANGNAPRAVLQDCDNNAGTPE